MPNSPVCTIADPIANSVCFRTPRLDAVRRKAIQVYAMALELAALGGTDYTADFTQLLQDSCAWLNLEPGRLSDQRDAALTRIFLNNAEGAGASVPATDVALMEAIACLKQHDLNKLEAMWFQLTCSLGFHETIT